jgi:hypothetical protein
MAAESFSNVTTIHEPPFDLCASGMISLAEHLDIVRTLEDSIVILKGVIAEMTITQVLSIIPAF